ncbi:hypothetical protein VNO78_26963 [Psophocarpus tetragonolobus]|uniref:Uncharacterized protein n=1 Tax=Psophocarpus tetragonolobus TaxID=3891 RepID=A0AAN9RZY9_PSOTE
MIVGEHQLSRTCPSILLPSTVYGSLTRAHQTPNNLVFAASSSSAASAPVPSNTPKGKLGSNTAEFSAHMEAKRRHDES